MEFVIEKVNREKNLPVVVKLFIHKKSLGSIISIEIKQCSELTGMVANDEKFELAVVEGGVDPQELLSQLLTV